MAGRGPEGVRAGGRGGRWARELQVQPRKEAFLITLKAGFLRPPGHQRNPPEGRGNQGRNQRLSLVPGDVEGGRFQRGTSPCHTLWGSVEGAGLGAGRCCGGSQPPSTLPTQRSRRHGLPCPGLGGVGGRGGGDWCFQLIVELPELTRLHALPSKRASHHSGVLQQPPGRLCAELQA